MDGMPEAQMASPGRPTSLSDMHPEQMPEARRELTIAAGAFEGLSSTVNELLTRLRDFQRDVEPRPDKESLGSPHLVVNSPYGREIRDLSDRISNLEYRVRYALNLLEL